MTVARPSRRFLRSARRVQLRSCSQPAMIALSPFSDFAEPSARYSTGPQKSGFRQPVRREPWPNLGSASKDIDAPVSVRDPARLSAEAGRS
jgi:hypothetical protein